MKKVITNGILLASLIFLLSGLTSLPAFSADEGANLEVYGRLVDQAQQYYKAGKLSDAIDVMEQALSVAEEQYKPACQNNLGAFYMKRGAYFAEQANDTTAALNDYRLALYWLRDAWQEGTVQTPTVKSNVAKAQQRFQELFYQAWNDNSVIQHLQQGRLLREAGEFKAALPEFKQALLQAPKNSEAAEALGDSYNLLNMPTQAVKYYKIALEQPPEERRADLSLRLANALYKAGDSQGALGLLNRVTDVDPTNTVALNYLETYWRKVLDNDGQNVLALANLGAIFQKKGNLTEALNLYYQAEQLAAEPERSLGMDVRLPLRLNVGSLLLQQGDLTEAETVFNQVLGVDAFHPKALAYLLKVGFLKGNPEPALERWKTGIANGKLKGGSIDLLVATIRDQAKQNNQVQAFHWLATALPNLVDIQRTASLELLKLNQPQWALESINQWQVLASNSTEMWKAKAQALTALNDEAGATEALRVANTLSSKAKIAVQVPPLLNNTYEAFLAKDYLKALKLAEDVVGLDPANALAFYYKGLSLEGLKRLPEAQIAYEQSANYAPTMAENHYALGVLYRKVGQLPKSKQAFRQFIALVGKKPVSEQQALQAQVAFAKKQVELPLPTSSATVTSTF
jgi:tetratricopeptide (TPR) repeat protein